MIKDDEILDFLVKLEKIQKAYDNTSLDTDGYSGNFSVVHGLVEQYISVKWDWMSYEEGGDYELYIHLIDHTYSRKEFINSVYGDYVNYDNGTFKVLDELYEKFLKNLINS